MAAAPWPWRPTSLTAVRSGPWPMKSPAGSAGWISSSITPPSTRGGRGRRSKKKSGTVMAVNLKGYFMCARAVYPHMKERGRGSIVNVASITFFIGWTLLIDYVASKGGFVGFTRTLAREVGPDNINVNAIDPGAFPTDAEKIPPDQEGYNRWVLEQQSIKRRGTPEDIGNLVAFLASDASSFITGQTIGIDGGWMMR